MQVDTELNAALEAARSGAEARAKPLSSIIEQWRSKTGVQDQIVEG